MGGEVELGATTGCYPDLEYSVPGGCKISHLLLGIIGFTEPACVCEEKVKNRGEKCYFSPTRAWSLKSGSISAERSGEFPVLSSKMLGDGSLPEGGYWPG